jgi:hypothetical protein
MRRLAAERVGTFVLVFAGTGAIISNDASTDTSSQMGSALTFGLVVLAWHGSRTWVRARAQSVLMLVWRPCWHKGCSAPDLLSQLLRGEPLVLASI